VAAIQSNSIPFAVADEGHPFDITSLPEEAVCIDEDLVGLREDIHHASSQILDGGSHVVDA
jgi:hypothetical protein